MTPFASSGWGEQSGVEAGRLPASWRGRERFVVLEAGCGGPDAFLACWQAWRDDPTACARLHFISVLPEPLSAAALHASMSAIGWPELAAALVDAWPAPTANLHRLAFDDGRVQLLLACAPLAEALGELAADVDAFWLGAVANASPRRLARALARLAAPGARLHARPSQAALDAAFGAALRAAGFVADRSAAGFDVEGVDTEPAAEAPHLWMRYAPAFVPRRPSARSAPRASSERPAAERHALIVGGGLAGCATAWALAEHGWRSTVLERHDAVAQEASGNPAGLFHGIVNRHDGTHARFNRAAALEVQRVVRGALAAGVDGQQQGLLRLEIESGHGETASPLTLAIPANRTDRAQRAERALKSMQATVLRLRLPADYVEALSPAEAGARAGLALEAPAWFYPGGGWVDPALLARHYLQRAGAAWRGGCKVAALHRADGAWELLDAAGGVIARSATVVLANAGDALRLLGATWPITIVRGQLSMLHGVSATGWRLPRLPLTGSGYLLPEVRGAAIWGATSQIGDADPSVRAADHRQNLAQVARLLGVQPSVDPALLAGRTAWRCVSDDRLPVVGAVPVESATRVSWSGMDVPGWRARRPPDQPRHVPRLPGLYVCMGLGSRGITWSALAAQLLAAAISGAPAPLEASLLDAVDPARFIARRNRRATGHQP